jgi:membrane protease YdiL (CAAX protease family)
MFDHTRPAGALPQPPARGVRLFAAPLLAVLGLLLLVNVVDALGPARAGLVVGPAVATALVALARRAGLSWDDLGMGRRSWRPGAIYGGVGVAVVAAVYGGVVVLLPAARAAFLDHRYHLAPGPALLTALVVVPLGTVLVEEVAFRGVLLALVRHHRGTAWASGISSALFGLWHVLPSLRLDRANHAVGAVFGHGVLAQVLVVAVAVGFTAGAGLVFCELRRRSGSVLASAGLHWATNGLGVMVAATLWSLH